MKPFIMAVGLSVGLAAAPVAAQSYRASNHVDVTPVAGGFFVEDGGSFGARSTWCAASDYARRRLGAGGSARIYVKVPRSRAAGGTVFTLDPTGLTPTPVLIVGFSVKQAGANLSVDHASLFCDDERLPSR
jgi:hypothetical protein